MKHLLACLLLAALAPFSVAHANNCASTKTEMGMNACADAAYKKADAELNHVYQQIRGRLTQDKTTNDLLVSAQKRWVAFRNAECAFTSSAGVDGSIYPLLVTQCREALTNKRIDELKPMLNCQEGDMSCPVPPR